MKRILLVSSIVAISSIQSCINTSEENCSDSLHNEKQLANELMGTWKFWGRFSIERNNWIPAEPEQLFVYEFKSDGTYTYVDKSSGELLSGSFRVIPADDKTNPYIILDFKNEGVLSYKKLLVVYLDKKFISIFEHPNEDRYQKQ